MNEKESDKVERNWAIRLGASGAKWLEMQSGMRERAGYKVLLRHEAGKLGQSHHFLA